MTSLGIRNNNPCNVRYSSLNTWQGQIGKSKGFCKFSSMDYGVRAVLSLLRVYRFNYGLDTIRKIITRFAPSSENDTEKYISFVVSHFPSHFDIDADTILNLDFYDFKGVYHLYYLVRAMCFIESKFVLTLDQYERSLKLLHV